MQLVRDGSTQVLYIGDIMAEGEIHTMLYK
jgi:hypothetical protein